jgi:4-hydroxy-tetrahydrodipicolinate synthase
MFKGSLVAVITPFKNGKLDEDALRKLVNFHIENGTDGIIPCGTTGESATLSYKEHEDVIRIVVDEVRGRIPVIAGTGSNNTVEAVELTKAAKEIGADGALVITPYYNKPTQEGLYQHFKAVAEAVNIPIVMYNVPGRTAVNMLPETVGRLAKISNIVGIKDATGSMQVLTEILLNTSDEEFCLLSGDDFVYFPFLCCGGDGVISVVANIAPKITSQLYDNFVKGNFQEARKLHFAVNELAKVMFLQTNPIPVKKAAALMGLVEDEIRLPLVSMEGDAVETLRNMMQKYDLI